jgi:hypothetical protein
MTEIKKKLNVSTFEKMLNLQTLIKKESALKELCNYKN